MTRKDDYIIKQSRQIDRLKERIAKKDEQIIKLKALVFRYKEEANETRKVALKNMKGSKWMKDLKK